MNSNTALARALRETFDPEFDTDLSSWERISRKVIAALRDDGEFDVMESHYCETCPVRKTIEKAMKRYEQRDP